MVSLLFGGIPNARHSTLNGLITVYLFTKRQAFRTKWSHYCLAAYQMPGIPHKMVSLLFVYSPNTGNSTLNGLITVWRHTKRQAFHTKWSNYCLAVYQTPGIPHYIVPLLFGCLPNARHSTQNGLITVCLFTKHWEFHTKWSHYCLSVHKTPGIPH